MITLLTESRIFFLFFLMLIYFWERGKVRGRECTSGEGTKRGRHRIWSRLQSLSCQHRARRGTLTNYEIMTWAKVGRLTDWATQVPPQSPIFKLSFFLWGKGKNIFRSLCTLDCLVLFILNWFLNTHGETLLFSRPFSFLLLSLFFFAFTRTLQILLQLIVFDPTTYS